MDRKQGTRARKAYARKMYWVAVGRVLPDGGLGCSVPHVEHLIELARNGDSAAERVVKEVAAKFIRGGVVPPFLEKYLVEELTAPINKRRKPPGKDPYDNDFRDFCIFWAVGGLMKDAKAEGRKLLLTRNRASRDKDGIDSACSLVAKAGPTLGFHLSESAVEKIVREQARRIQPFRKPRPTKSPR